MNPISIIIVPIPLYNRMAGSKRLQNLFIHFSGNENIYLHNFFFNPVKSQFNSILESDIKVNTQEFFLPKRNILSIFLFSIAGLKFLIKYRTKKGKSILYHYSAPDIKTILLILFARLLGYKIVFDLVEDIFTVEPRDCLKAKIRFAFTRILTRMIKRLSHGIVVISSHLEYLANTLTKEKIPILKVPVSINIKEIEYLADIQPPSESIRVFYGGSYGKKDGLKYLLKAFDAVSEDNPNMELILTGKGSDTDMAVFHDELSSIKARSKVQYLGFLSEEEYRRVLFTCHIYCVTREDTPYANAGFPFKLGEYLATGRPVIISNVGEVSEILNDTNAFIVRPESVDAIVDCLKFIINNPKKSQIIGSRGKGLAYKHFNSEIHSKGLLELFKKL